MLTKKKKKKRSETLFKKKSMKSRLTRYRKSKPISSPKKFIKNMVLD